MNLSDLLAEYQKPKATSKALAMVGDNITLCAEQSAAVDQILNSHAAVQILTGVAGSGKSTVVNSLMRNYGHKVGVCATTGRAAVNNGSMVTVDSMFGINRKDWKLNGRDRLHRCGRVVLIDEGSMVGVKMYDLIRTAATMNDKRIVLVGDWTQAKPVMDEWITKSTWFQEDEAEIIRLVENHRQGEGPFLSELNKIRVGKHDQATADLFRGRVVAEPPPGDHVVRLYATNADASSYNDRAAMEHARNIGWPLVRLTSHFYDRREMQAWTVRQKEINDLFDAARLANDEPMTYGARVMITYNSMPTEDAIDREYVNGDLGVLEDLGFIKKKDLDAYLNSSKLSSADTFYVEELPEPTWMVADRFGGSPEHIILWARVKLDRNDRSVIVNPIRSMKTSMYRDQEQPLYEAVGIPIYSGYAITIHKSQGGTMDHVWMSMKSIRRMRRGDDGFGWHGLAYVGLSRARKLEGLYLDCWDPETVMFDPTVKDLL
jgi:ATP-dependent exoDNAse (exonuclease V) alpha subunit